MAYLPYHDDDDNQNEFDGTDLQARPKTESTKTPEELDTYVVPHLNFPRGGRMVSGNVKQRAISSDGWVIRQANDNPILDTRRYIVKFPDCREHVH